LHHNNTTALSDVMRNPKAASLWSLRRGGFKEGSPSKGGLSLTAFGYFLAAKSNCLRGKSGKTKLITILKAKQICPPCNHCPIANYRRIAVLLGNIMRA